MNEKTCDAAVSLLDSGPDRSRQNPLAFNSRRPDEGRQQFSMDSRWQKIEEAVWLASEMPAAERSSWLAEFCAGDAGLKAQIESLLACRAEAENFLEDSPARHAAEILCRAIPSKSSGAASFELTGSCESGNFSRR